MRILTALFCLALAAVPAAQDFGRQGRGGPGGFLSPVVQALDANRDGTVSAAEIDNAPTAIKALDVNADGQVAAAELMPAGRGRGPEGREGGARGRGGPGNEPGETPATSPDELATLLMAFDTNQDGVLARTELPERLQPLFDRADADKDGKLTADEIRKSAAAAAQPNAMGGRRGGEGRGEGRGEERGEGRGFGPGGDRLTQVIDANHDGTLSAAEISAAPAALRTLDANKDGQLTPEEYRTMGRGL
jgi:Ca2+-binding EF-hand superfamily protein